MKLLSMAPFGPLPHDEEVTGHDFSLLVEAIRHLIAVERCPGAGVLQDHPIRLELADIEDDRLRHSRLHQREIVDG